MSVYLNEKTYHGICVVSGEQCCKNVSENVMKDAQQEET